MRVLTQLSRSSQIFIGLAVLYLLLSFILPANNTTKAIYTLSDLQYFSLLFTVRLPIVAVWCAAWFSYRSLKRYVNRIQDTPEGKDYKSIERGMAWIAWGLPIPAIISTFLNAIANQAPDFLMFALIITNYLYLVVALFAFTYISVGVHRLAVRSNTHLSTKQIRWLIFGLVALGVIFCNLILAKLGDSGDMFNAHNSYYLANILVWTTIVIPYLYAWFLGLFAATELMMLANSTKGIIYKQALQFLAGGLVLVIVSMCLLQYFRSVIPRTGYLTIGGTLVTSYAIYAVHLAGSLLLAVGARRLKRIEDA